MSYIWPYDKATWPAIGAHPVTFLGISFSIDECCIVTVNYHVLSPVGVMAWLCPW